MTDFLPARHFANLKEQIGEELLPKLPKIPGVRYTARASLRSIGGGMFRGNGQAYIEVASIHVDKIRSAEVYIDECEFRLNNKEIKSVKKLSEAIFVLVKNLRKRRVKDEEIFTEKDYEKQKKDWEELLAQVIPMGQKMPKNIGYSYNQTPEHSPLHSINIDNSNIVVVILDPDWEAMKECIGEKKKGVMRILKCVAIGIKMDPPDDFMVDVNNFILSGSFRTTLRKALKSAG